MNAELYYQLPSAPPIVKPLGKAPVVVGSGAKDEIYVEGLQPRHLEIRWDGPQSTWVAVAGPSAPVVAGGRNLSPGRPHPLAYGDVLYLPGFALRFTSSPAAPLYKGVALGEVALTDQRLVIGRQSSTRPEQTEQRLDLDPDCAAISREHSVIELIEGRHWLVDSSRTGTFLNGATFDRACLVYGDRFLIHDYVFEYTGTGLRWVRPDEGGQVEAQNLSVDVKVDGKDLRILHHVSITARTGEFIGIIGGSGQGKSTMMNSLAGVVPASDGTVLINGVPVQDDRVRLSRSVGYVPQDDIVHRELTVRDALLFSARIRLKLPPQSLEILVDNTMARLQLTEHQHKRVGRLSGGQRKRVSIATELLSSPSVLFLDEPSSGLDPYNEEELMKLLQKLTLNGLTVICTTHVLQNASLFNKICVIHEARLVFMGAPDDALLHFFASGSERSSIDLNRTPLSRIYRLLLSEKGNGEKWEARYRQSLERAGSHAVAAPALPKGEFGDRGRKKPSSCAALRILIARQWLILISDWRNPVFLLVQALFIGGLIGWVTDRIELQMFLALVAILWFGCGNAAQHIVSETAIFQRERVGGLGNNTYWLSKAVFIGLITLFQAAILGIITENVSRICHPSDFSRSEFIQHPKLAGIEERFSMEAESTATDKPTQETKAGLSNPGASVISGAVPPSMVVPLGYVAEWFHIDQNLLDALPTPGQNTGDDGISPRPGLGDLLAWTVVLRLVSIISAALVGVGLGLAVSSLVRTPTQAVMWVPLLMIPQILLGGYVITRPEMSRSVRGFAHAVPSHAVHRMAEASMIYGQLVPRPTNLTEIPVFIGKKKTVRWGEGPANKEEYDLTSKFNTSWQNFIVRSDLVGQRKIDKTGISRPAEAQIARRDVEPSYSVWYKKLYLERSSALFCAGICLVWLCGCYTLSIIGLNRIKKA